MKNITEIARVDIQSTLGTITSNLDEVEVRLNEEFEELLNLKITEEDLKVAKDSLADARKLKKALEDKRKSIKKEWNKPYDDFEKKFKKAISSVDKYIENVDKQVKDFELKEIESKKEDIEELIALTLENKDESLGKFVDSVLWFKNPKWINKSYTMAKIQKEVDANIAQIEQNLAILAREDENIYNSLLQEYRRTGDISSVLILKEDLIRQAEETARLKAKSMEEQLAREAERQKQEEQQEINFEKEYHSVPLTNENWQQEQSLQHEEQKTVDASPVEEEKPVDLDTPVLAYTCERDSMKVNIGYSVTGDVAVVRYIKQMAEYYGAKFEVTKKPTKVEE